MSYKSFYRCDCEACSSVMEYFTSPMEWFVVRARESVFSYIDKDFHFCSPKCLVTWLFARYMK